MRRLLAVALVMISLAATPVVATQRVVHTPAPVASGCYGTSGGVCPLSVVRGTSL